MKKDISFSVVLLAGGVGSRMKSTIPKQYLSLQQKPLVLHSFECFLNFPGVKEIIVVCDPFYQSLFQSSFIPLSFALPGQRRQDSVFNGFQQFASDTLVCIHDSVRPLIDEDLISRVVQAADQYGAAALGVPVKGTIKICDTNQMVVHTPKRSSLWEMQTPQVIRSDLLKQGFLEAQNKNLTVTDDVELMELIKHPVKIVEGSYTNIKVTTPDDFMFVEHLLDRHV